MRSIAARLGGSLLVAATGVVAAMSAWPAAAVDAPVTISSTEFEPPVVAGTVGPVLTVVVDPGAGDPGDSGAPTIPTTTAVTTTTTTTTTSTTTTTTTTTTTDSGPAGTATTTVGPPGALEVVPGPLSDGGPASVVAQGIVELSDGSFGWEHQPLDLSAAPFTYQQSPPVFFASDGPTTLICRIDGASAALLDTGEATFVPGGAGGDVGQIVPGGTATAHRIALVAGAEPLSFTPGAGRRDLNLVRGVLDPGETLHVVSPFPVLVIVTEGVVLDAPEGTPLAAGTARPLNDAELSNASAARAIVLIAAVGGPVP